MVINSISNRLANYQAGNNQKTKQPAFQARVNVTEAALRVMEEDTAEIFNRTPPWYRGDFFGTKDEFKRNVSDKLTSLGESVKARGLLEKLEKEEEWKNKLREEKVSWHYDEIEEDFTPERFKGLFGEFVSRIQGITSSEILPENLRDGEINFDAVEEGGKRSLTMSFATKDGITYGPEKMARPTHGLFVNNMHKQSPGDGSYDAYLEQPKREATNALLVDLANLISPSPQKAQLSPFNRLFYSNRSR